MPHLPSILLIEDEANLRHNLGVLLEGEGYRVVTAEDGAEGIRRLQEELFDLVITDVVMPEVDGFQVMEYLKDYAPDVVVVAITAYVSAESAIEALRHGAYDYLAKPFDVDLMQIVIKRALEKARMQRAFRHYMGELDVRWKSAHATSPGRKSTSNSPWRNSGPRRNSWPRRNASVPWAR
jgi:DNA-binding NtrC family response regulator